MRLCDGEVRVRARLPLSRERGRRTDKAVQTSDDANDETIHLLALVGLDQFRESRAFLRGIGESRNAGGQGIWGRFQKNEDQRTVSCTRTSLGVHQRVQQEIDDTVHGDPCVRWIELHV